jgi:adenylate cyclase
MARDGKRGLPESKRRLAAIMFTDIIGYTAMVQSDESRALDLLRRHRELAREVFGRHLGMVVKTTGDGFLVEFASVLSATECAVDLESAFGKDEPLASAGLRVRIGIHVGDIVHEEDDVFGDAVNVASRIQSLAQGGGICVSQQAFDQVRNKVAYGFSRLDTPELKNVSVPIDVYRLELESEGEGATPPADPDSRRVAVLPLVNLSPDPSDEYFADGMTEELISTISNIKGIDVISRTSVMRYKKNPRPLKDVARELAAGMVLEGSVRKAGSKIRVTVQLIDARRDRHVWAESYDREFADVFEIQTGIARQVADALRVRISPKTSERMEGRSETDAGAYTQYLKGRFHWNRRGLEDIKKAIACFERTVAEDPRFALGYVGLGDSYQVLRTRFGQEVEENRRKTKEMVARALELDPRLAEAHATAGVAMLFDFDMRGAESQLRRATELKPSYASAHQWYSQVLIALQKWEEARFHIEKAAELDPFSHIICLIHTFLYEAKRDYGSGLELAKRAVELNPEDPSSYFELAFLYGKLKMSEEARRAAATGVRLAGAFAPQAALGAQAMLALLEEDRPSVRELLSRLKEHVGETFTTVRFIADLHFYLGEDEEGFAWLERSWSEREFDLIYIKSDEFLDRLREVPRYKDLLRRLGLA